MANCERISVMIDQDFILSKLSGLKISNAVSTGNVSSKAFSIYVIKSLTNGFPTDDIKCKVSTANSELVADLF